LQEVWIINRGRKKTKKTPKQTQQQPKKGLQMQRKHYNYFKNVKIKKKTNKKELGIRARK